MPVEHDPAQGSSPGFNGYTGGANLARFAERCDQTNNSCVLLNQFNGGPVTVRARQF
jgi:hypothetical protein